MATLTIATSFLADYARLENRLQRRLRDLVTKFAQMTPAELGKQKGINLEPYNGSADPRSRTIRITDNHRGIVLDVGDGEHFVLTRVCTHDEAERWMANNTFKINATTNALELMDTTAIEAEAAVVQEQADPAGDVVPVAIALERSGAAAVVVIGPDGEPAGCVYARDVVALTQGTRA